MEKIFGIFILVFFVVITGICSIIPAFGYSEITITAGAGASASAACVIAENCYYPPVFSTKVGNLVSWHNGDSISHTVTSGRVTDDNSGSLFDSSLIYPGGYFNHQFNYPGIYNYFCTVHPWMIGQVSVSENILPQLPPPTPTCPSGSYYHASDNLCYRIIPPSLTLQTPSVNGLEATISGSSQPMTSWTSINRISWNWGDGYTVDGFFPQSHIYSQAGSYSVIVTAYDTLGSSRWEKETVTVTQPPPTCQQGFYLEGDNQCHQLIPPTLSVASQVDGLIVTISGNSKAMTTGASISKIQADWGDGQTSSSMNLPQSHTYLQAGTYSIIVTSYDNMGNSIPVSTQATVTSYTPPPSIPQSTQTIQQPTTIQQTDVPQNGVVATSTSDGQVQVSLNYGFEQSSDGKRSVNWNVFFKDSNGEPIPHSNYAISVMQDGQQLLHQTADYASSGVAGDKIFDLKSFNPIGFNIIYLGKGLQYAEPSTWSGAKGGTAYLEIPNTDLKSNPSDTSITISTNKNQYTKGDKITVVGVAIASGSLEPVGLSITDPNGNKKYLASSQVDNGETFSSLINIDDSFIKGDGKYTITASYHDTFAKTEITITEPKTCFLFWCW